MDFKPFLSTPNLQLAKQFSILFYLYILFLNPTSLHFIFNKTQFVSNHFFSISKVPLKLSHVHYANCYFFLGHDNWVVGYDSKSNQTTIFFTLFDVSSISIPYSIFDLI